MIRSSFEDLAAGLEAHVSKAERCLRQAQQELDGRAFAPFWDRIEAAAKNLSEFHRSIDELDSKAKSYYRLLSGKAHNFPPLNDLSQRMPDPEPAVAELRRLVRQGQTDIEFATIWEHRKTRRELVSVLGDVIADVGSSISYGVEDLRSTLASGLDEVTREQRRMGEKLEAAIRK